MKRLDVDENTAISMPARNLITIIGACLVGAWFGFGVIERLNNIETKLQLMEKDLEAANTFIDGVPLRRALSHKACTQIILMIPTFYSFVTTIIDVQTKYNNCFNDSHFFFLLNL